MGQWIAVGDETAGRYPDGRLLYAMAFPLLEEHRQAELRLGLRGLLRSGDDCVHYKTCHPRRRAELAEAVAGLPWSAALVSVRVTGEQRQERTRARILAAAVPRLHLTEDVRTLRLESRGGGDRHDIRTRERLIGSARLSRDFELEHVRKTADELLWLADVVAGAFRAAELGQQQEPWEVLGDQRLIEVQWLAADSAADLALNSAKPGVPL